MRLYSIAAAVCTVFAISLAAAVGQAPRIELIGPAGNQLAEGRTYVLRWTGQGIDAVTITAEGNLISRPDNPRGRFREIIAENVDADTGEISWLVPFLDTLRFRITATGYDGSGKVIAEDSKEYLFRPEVLRTRTADGIYIDLRSAENQRLYRLENNEVTNAYMTSGARTRIFLPRSRDMRKPHDHVGVFRVTDKYPMYWSRTYSVWMTHSMRFWKGHFIHGTEPGQYYLLGRPASSGCVRLDRKDASELYELTKVGTRVEIFGNLS